MMETVSIGFGSESDTELYLILTVSKKNGKEVMKKVKSINF